MLRNQCKPLTNTRDKNTLWGKNSPPCNPIHDKQREEASDRLVWNEGKVGKRTAKEKVQLSVCLEPLEGGWDVYYPVILKITRGGFNMWMPLL